MAAEAWLQCEGGYAETTEPPGLLRLKESKTERGAFEFVFVIRKGGGADNFQTQTDKTCSVR